MVFLELVIPSYGPYMASIALRNEKTNATSKETTLASFVSSQLVLFQSRKKWGVLYSFATITGLLGASGLLSATLEMEMPALLQKVLPLPIISMLIAVGMFILNDLLDADLDRANRKKRPIPSGRVTKGQTWFFILLTNGAAVLLSVVTLNPASVIITALMIILGIMYSAPKIGLACRFLIKTLSVSLAIILCAMLGASASPDLGGPAMFHIAAMLGTMNFITSTLNDSGDVAGDRAAGRRTIPIVLGFGNTIKLTIVLALAMPAVSWAFNAMVGTGLIASVLVSVSAAVVVSKLVKILTGPRDMEYMRKQHKKIFPMHLILQSGLITGALLV